MTNCIQAAFSGGGGAGGVTVERVQVAVEDDFTTTSSSLVDLTSMTATLPNIDDGFATIGASAECRISIAEKSYKFTLHNGATVLSRNPQVGSSEERLPTVAYYVDDADGGTIKVQVSTNGGTLSVYGSGDSTHKTMDILGVG